MKFTNFRRHSETRAVFRLEFPGVALDFFAQRSRRYTFASCVITKISRFEVYEKEGLCGSVTSRLLFGGRMLGNNIGVNCGSWRRGELALVTSWTMPNVKYAGFAMQFPKSAGKHVVESFPLWVGKSRAIVFAEFKARRNRRDSPGEPL